MKKLFIGALAVLALSSCTTSSSLYSWYDSEDASYQYVKKGTEKTIMDCMMRYRSI